MRSSGVLLHISSLPTPYGIGSLGKEAYDFIDFLSSGRQKYWQILPLGLTGYGDSPYQSFTVFGTNPYFIDLPFLCKKGLITEEELRVAASDNTEGRIDYGILYEKRMPLLMQAAARMASTAEFEAFKKKEAYWLEDYALFMAVKHKLGGVGLADFPDDIKNREPAVLQELQEELKAEAEGHKTLQYLFAEQWQSLKKYAREKGIAIVGDMPIYVAWDSAEMWTRPELFMTDSKGRPDPVAGCPPDYFSPRGQLWGNPLYRWESHREDHYKWWNMRMNKAQEMYEAVRIDHFKGFTCFYAIPRGEEFAVVGEWMQGPGIEFVESLKRSARDSLIIAEDLGELNEEAKALLAESGIPGMRVLQFAFDSDYYNTHLPHNYGNNCVAYTGTHDNPPTEAWRRESNQGKLDFACAYMRKHIGEREGESFVRSFIRQVLHSPADMTIIPLQDWLELGQEGRMNLPSTAAGNWTWRLKEGQLDAELARDILKLTTESGRNLQ